MFVVEVFPGDKGESPDCGGGFVACVREAGAMERAEGWRNGFVRIRGVAISGLRATTEARTAVRMAGKSTDMAVNDVEDGSPPVKVTATSSPPFRFDSCL